MDPWINVSMVGSTRAVRRPVDQMQATVIGLLLFPENAGDNAEFLPWTQIAMLSGSERALQELIGGGPRKRSSAA
jgi:hypothetical protein